MTVSEFVGLWGSTPLGQPVGEIWRKDRATLLHRFVQMWGQLDIRQVGTQHVLAVQQECIADGLSPISTNKIVTCVGVMLRDAALKGLVPYTRRDDVIRPIAKLRPIPRNGRDAFWTEDRDLILKTLTAVAPEFVPFVGWQFCTGMRPSETLGLDMNHVDLIGGSVEIVQARRGNTLTSLKTARSWRTISLTRLARVYLQRACQNRTGTDLVFVNAMGTPINYNNFCARIWRGKVLRALAGRVPALNFYRTRAYFITQQLEAGQNTKEIADYCGTSMKIIDESYNKRRRVIPITEKWNRAMV